MSDGDECPHCGAPLRPGAVACRECGSDFETGWSGDADTESVELPEEPASGSPGPALRTIAVVCVIALLGGAIHLFGGDPWLIIVAVVVGSSLAFGIRRGDEPRR